MNFILGKYLMIVGQLIFSSDSSHVCFLLVDDSVGSCYTNRDLVSCRVDDDACGPSLSLVVIGNNHSFTFPELLMLSVDLSDLLGLRSSLMDLLDLCSGLMDLSNLLGLLDFGFSTFFR